MILGLWENEQGNRGVTVRNAEEKMYFSIDCKPHTVIEFFDRHRGDELIQCSSDVNHPTEFGLPDDFDVEGWLKGKLGNYNMKMVDTDALTVIYNGFTKQYSVIINDLKAVKLTINDDRGEQENDPWS